MANQSQQAPAPVVDNYALYTRMETVGIVVKLRKFLLDLPTDVRGEVRNEIGSYFREFERQNPNAGIGEIDGLRVVLDLVNGRNGALQEFVSIISKHNMLFIGLQKLVYHI